METSRMPHHFGNAAVLFDRPAARGNTEDMKRQPQLRRLSSKDVEERRFLSIFSNFCFAQAIFRLPIYSRGSFSGIPF